mmetsp:Transcript_41716/g.50581  ORF Transcript_41716/g.50581 Transcript_41716/m.50581 type:complete len:206 (-) Transcript_41716:264-881(-)
MLLLFCFESSSLIFSSILASCCLRPLRALATTSDPFLIFSGIPAAFASADSSWAFSSNLILFSSNSLSNLTLASSSSFCAVSRLASSLLWSSSNSEISSFRARMVGAMARACSFSASSSCCLISFRCLWRSFTSSCSICSLSLHSAASLSACSASSLKTSTAERSSLLRPALASTLVRSVWSCVLSCFAFDISDFSFAIVLMSAS